jgi:hypothetical protein
MKIKCTDWMLFVYLFLFIYLFVAHFGKMSGSLYGGEWMISKQ